MTNESNEDLKAAEELAIILTKWISPVEDHNTNKAADGDEDVDMVSGLLRFFLLSSSILNNLRVHSLHQVANTIAYWNIEENGEAKKRKQYNELVQRCRALAGPAISAIHELLLLTGTSNTRRDANTNLDEVLITLIAFASFVKPSRDQEDAEWTPPGIPVQAETTLLDEKILPPGASRDQFIIDGILGRYLRPLFSKTKRPAAVTVSGRKAAYPHEDDESGLPDDSWVTKPWKFTDHRAIPVFAWAVDKSDVGSPVIVFYHLPAWRYTFHLEVYH